LDILISNADLLLTLSEHGILRNASIVVEENEIIDFGKNYEIERKYGRNFDYVIDAKGMIVVPGFIQTHVHLVQTIFRGLADDLSLLDWLGKRILPMEARISAEGVYYSSLLACIELLMSGTTTIVDFGSVRHQEKVFEAIRDSGIRAFSGKVIMDMGDSSVPKELIEDYREALSSSVNLLKRWNGFEERIWYAFSPRFALSCSEECLRETAYVAREHNALIQTHASENRDEVRLVRKITGMNNVEYLHKVGLTGRDVILAHCIWINDYEMEILHRTGTNVVHCPSANMKLGSGIARVPEMLEKGINVTIGADGAPCNNNLDVFVEMRHASLIQKARLTDPRVLPAREVIRMATVNGAKALGISDIGSIRRGSKADLVLISLRDINVTPFTSLHDPYSTIVYSAKASNVKYTIVDGRIAVAEGRPTIDLRDLVERVRDIAFKFAEKIVN